MPLNLLGFLPKLPEIGCPLAIFRWVAPKVVNKGPKQGVAAKKQPKIPNHVKAQQKKGGLGL